MGQIDYGELKRTEIRSEREELVERAVEGGAYPCISDAMVNRDRHGADALVVFEELNKTGRLHPDAGPFQYQWILRVIRHRNGQPPKAGDVFRWKRQVYNRERKRRGLKLSGRLIRDAIRRGEGHRFVDLGEAVIDERGCIKLGYGDASQLLHNHGVHYDTGIAISGMRDKSRGPVEQEDGSKTHVWNWLAEEVLPEEYDDLETIQKADKPTAHDIAPSPEGGRRPWTEEEKVRFLELVKTYEPLPKSAKDWGEHSEELNRLFSRTLDGVAWKRTLNRFNKED